jgi:hypothetical protein
MLVRASLVLEWMFLKFGQKVFIPKTRLLGTHMVHMGCLLYNTQKTNNKNDSLDAVPKVQDWKASNDFKLWRRGVQTMGKRDAKCGEERNKL